MQERLGIVIISILKFIIIRLPRKRALGLGHWLGNTIFERKKGLKDVILGNLKIAFKDSKSEEELLEIARKSVINSTKTLVEFFRLPLFDKEMDEYFKVSGKENLKKLRAAGKGVILVSAHMGNWELFAAYLGLSGYPILALMRDQSIPALDKLVEKYRNDACIITIRHGMGLKKAVDGLTSGKILLTLADQHGGNSGVPGLFFGRLVSLPKGPALFSVRTNSVLLPAFVRRMEDDTLHLTIEEPLEIPESIKGNVEKIARHVGKLIEQRIKEDPQQWVWTYMRWAHDLAGMKANMEDLL